jgi:HlyD family secretion protein
MKSDAIAAAVAALVCLGSGGCGSRNPGPDGSGTIEATEVRVAPEVGGRLAAVLVREGDVVVPGQVVARIDPALMEMKRDEALAAERLARAQMDLVAAGSRDEDIQRARAMFEEASAAAWAAAQDWKRVKEVFDKGSVSAKQADDTKAMADRTAAARAAAEKTLERLVAGSREQEVRAAQAALDVALSRLAQAEKAVRDATVTAPLGGVVVLKSAEEGEMISAGSPVATIARTDEVWLSVYVPEDRLALLKLGQKAAVRVDGLDRDFTGTVSFISPDAEFSPKNVQTSAERAKLVYRVKILLRNPEGIFKAGMPADAWMREGE